MKESEPYHITLNVSAINHLEKLTNEHCFVGYVKFQSVSGPRYS